MLDRKDLHAYHNAAVAHILPTPYVGLFLDMGLGKTVSTLTAINVLIYEELEVQKVLVIAPKRVVEAVWTGEIKKWRHLQHLTTSRVIGTAKQRKHALAKDADIYLVSRDNIAWLIGLYGGSMLPFDMLVIDESSSFKNHKSVRFKALRKVRPSFNRVVLLTGTPAPNGLIDIWAQIYLLDMGDRLGKFITHYREKFFSKGYGVWGKYTVREDAEQRIYSLIGDICISMKQEDYLDLPPRIDHYIRVQFPEELQQKYDAFEREQVLEILSTEEGEEITAVNAAALSTKLLQFANGAVYDEDRKVHEVHTMKLDAAEELVEAAQGKPVLIAYTYKHDFTRLMERLKKYSPRGLKKEKDITEWNEGKVPVMIMHPASGGHGLNLQDGGHIGIWFGQTWSLELYQQWCKRLDRQGQKETVQMYHIVASKTLEGEVIQSIKNKDKTQAGLLTAVKARIEK